MTIERARLREVDPATHKPVRGHDLEVQFNPESLKVSYTNQVSPAGAASSGGQQHVGSGSTRLAVQLWFDVTAPGPGNPVDVRQLTEQVLYFITPDTKKKHPVPPLLRFEWGTFSFEGVVESLEESLEFFSAQGIPLRASVSLSMSQPRLQAPVRAPPPPPAAPGASTASGSPTAPGALSATTAPGTRELTPAPAGATLQALAASRGGDPSQWRALADANNLETPRRIPTGVLLDLEPRVKGAP